MLEAELFRDFVDVLATRDLQLRLHVLAELHFHDEDLIIVSEDAPTRRGGQLFGLGGGLGVLCSHILQDAA